MNPPWKLNYECLLTNYLCRSQEPFSPQLWNECAFKFAQGLAQPGQKHAENLRVRTSTATTNQGTKALLISLLSLPAD